MENLLSSAASHETLPDSFVLAADQRPPASSAAVELPVIDLSRPRDEVRRAVLEAGKELGFFQVVNHGVPEDAMRGMDAACEEFFRLPAEAKAAFYSDDTARPNRLFSSTTYGTGGERYWRDCFRLACGFPVSDATRNAWPDGVREAAERFIPPTRGLGMELLRLLCEGVGLRPDHFDGALSGGDVVVNVNRYPPCPDPARALGLPPHCDRNLITLLRQGCGVPGLQVAYRSGEWIGVRPVPGAFVVNFGHQLEDVHHAHRRLPRPPRRGARRRRRGAAVPRRHVPRVHAGVQGRRRAAGGRREGVPYLLNDTVPDDRHRRCCGSSAAGSACCSWPTASCRVPPGGVRQAPCWANCVCCQA